jgi:hypothetical protein
VVVVMHLPANFGGPTEPISSRPCQVSYTVRVMDHNPALRIRFGRPDTRMLATIKTISSMADCSLGSRGRLSRRRHC